MGVFTQDGAVTLPVLSAEVDSVPSQPSNMIDVPVAEALLTRAPSPEPRELQVTIDEDAGGRSDTQILGFAEELAFLLSGTGIVHICSSASRTACGLWSEPAQCFWWRCVVGAGGRLGIRASASVHFRCRS